MLYRFSVFGVLQLLLCITLTVQLDTCLTRRYAHVLNQYVCWGGGWSTGKAFPDHISSQIWSLYVNGGCLCAIQKYRYLRCGAPGELNDGRSIEISYFYVKL